MTFRSSHSNDLRVLYRRGVLNDKRHDLATGQVAEVSGILKEVQAMLFKKEIKVGKSKQNPREQENIRKYGNTQKEQVTNAITRIDLGSLTGDKV